MAEPPPAHPRGARGRHRIRARHPRRSRRVAPRRTVAGRAPRRRAVFRAPHARSPPRAALPRRGRPGLGLAGVRWRRGTRSPRRVRRGGDDPDVCHGDPRGGRAAGRRLRDRRPRPPGDDRHRQPRPPRPRDPRGEEFSLEHPPREGGGEAGPRNRHLAPGEGRPRWLDPEVGDIATRHHARGRHGAAADRAARRQPRPDRPGARAAGRRDRPAGEEKGDPTGSDRRLRRLAPGADGLGDGRCGRRRRHAPRIGGTRRPARRRRESDRHRRPDRLGPPPPLHRSAAAGAAGRRGPPRGRRTGAPRGGRGGLAQGDVPGERLAPATRAQAGPAAAGLAP